MALLAGMGLPQEDRSDAPEERAHVCPRCGQSHPGAGCGGVVPPVASRIQPGQAFNPGGRPKGASVVAALRRKLAENPNEHGEGAEAERVAAEFLAASRSGEEQDARRSASLSRLVEHIDGKPRQTITATGVSAPPTIIVHTTEIRAPEMPALPEESP